MSARLVIVAALQRDGGVGIDGMLPWSLPEDLKRFKALTLGSAVCFGRRTMFSLPGQQLPGRHNILISKSGVVHPRALHHEASIVKSVAEALAIVDGPLFAIGGRQVWEEAFNLATEFGVPTLAYLTRVHKEVKCDTFFPRVILPFTRILRQPGSEADFEIWSSF